MEHIGRYKILSPLGRGAMGVVYLAEDPLLHRQAAVKTIGLAIDDPSRLEFLRGRLLRDARAAAALLHPNIVSIFDVVAEGETDAIIMEYVARIFRHTSRATRRPTRRSHCVSSPRWHRRSITRTRAE